jgi:hypothetical protein
MNLHTSVSTTTYSRGTASRFARARLETPSITNLMLLRTIPFFTNLRLPDEGGRVCREHRVLDGDMYHLCYYVYAEIKNLPMFSK